MNKKWRSLIPLLCAQFMGLIGLGTSTFAWFFSATGASLATSPSSTSFSAKEDTYSFSITDGTQAWTSGGSITVTEGTNKKLAPAAHETITTTVGERAQDPGRWYYKYADSATSSGSTGDKTYLTSSDFSQYVYAQDFYFKANSTITGIMVDSVTLPDVSKNMGVSVLFEGPNGHIEFKETTPLGFTEHVNLVANVGPETTPGKEYESPYKVTAYIYIDGNNEYVKTANAQYIKGAISFGFSIYTPEQVIYFQSKKNTFGAPYNNQPIIPYVHAWYYVEDGEGHSTKYQNAPYPGQPMTSVSGREDYYDTGCKENVTIWKKTFPIDAYTGLCITACDQSGAPIGGLETPTRETHDIAWSVENSGKMLAIANETTAEAGTNKQKYPFQEWVKFPEVLVNFYWQEYGGVTSSTLPVKTVNLIPGEIMQAEDIPINTRCMYPFKNWYRIDKTTGEPIEFKVNQQITASLLDEYNVLNLYSSYGDKIKEETFDILLEAKSDWDNGEMNKPMLYMYDSFTGENKGYKPLGNAISVRDGKVYYRVTLSNFYDMYRFEKATSSGTIITGNGKLKSDELHISDASENQGNCLYLMDASNYVAAFGGWISNYTHHVYFRDQNNNLITTLYKSDGEYLSSNDLKNISVPDEPHYIFDGWGINGEEQEFPYQVKSDLTFTPCWKAEEIYLLNASDDDSMSVMTKNNNNEYQISGVTLYKGDEIRIYSSKLHDITWKLDGFNGYSYKHSWSNTVETASYQDAKYFNYKVPMSSTNYTITYKPANNETYITADKNLFYFDPNTSAWDKDGAKFGIDCYNSSGAKIGYAEPSEKIDSYYIFNLPEGTSKLEFLRWNSSKTTVTNRSGRCDLGNGDCNNAFFLWTDHCWESWTFSTGSVGSWTSK